MAKEVRFCGVKSIRYPEGDFEADLGYMVGFCLKQTKTKVMLDQRENYMTTTPCREWVVSHIDLLFSYNSLHQGRAYPVLWLPPILKVLRLEMRKKGGY